MTEDFRLSALPIDMFRPLLSLSDGELRDRGARRLVVDKKPGFPCRVSLVDADLGERVLLVSITHHDVDSPYRASGPVFVREGAQTANPGVNEIPSMLRSRLLSVRAYDAMAMLVRSEVVDGKELDETIRRHFGDRNVQYLHLHNARPGCYNCRVERA